MIRQFFKMGCITFGIVLAMDCIKVQAMDIDTEKQQHIQLGDWVKTRAAQINAMLVQKCGDEQKARTAIDQMVQDLLNEANSDENVSKVLTGPNKETINENSERVRLIAQLLILLGKKTKDLESIKQGVWNLTLDQIDNTTIISNVLLIKYQKNMHILEHFHPTTWIRDEFDHASADIIRYITEKSYFDSLREGDWVKIDFSSLPTYRNLDLLKFLIASEGFVRVYDAYMKDKPQGEVSLADITDAVLTSWNWFGLPVNSIASPNKEFGGYSALSIAVKRFAMLLLNNKIQTNIDAQVLMYMEIIRHLTVRIMRDDDQTVENLKENVSEFKPIMKTTSFIITLPNVGAVLESSCLSKLIDIAFDKEITSDDLLQTIATEKKLNSVEEAEQYIKTALTNAAETRNNKNATQKGMFSNNKNSALANQYCLEHIDSYTKYMISETYRRINDDNKVKARRCLKTKIPNFKSNDRERTPGEAYSDCLVWLVTEGWMKGRVSGDVLKQAFQLGLELQGMGVIGENVNNGFINQAWNIIEDPSWNKTYPGSTAK